MTKWQGKSRRKTTGGRRVFYRKKKKYEIGPDFQPAVIGDPKIKRIRTRGGNQKIRVVHATDVNLSDRKGNVSRETLETVMENPCNPNYVQRNILTKGAIVSTSKGKARITSRPGQDGVINAILLED